jgi:hypothetical protein
LRRQVAAQAAGVGSAETAGEVVPFEAVPVQPVDPRLAWDEALAAIPFFIPETNARSCKAPPEWSAAVAAQEPATAVAFCVGNFPQLVRNLHPLLQATDLTTLRPAGSRPVAAPALADWAGRAAGKKEYPHALIALGSLRLAQNFDGATEVFGGLRTDAPEAWRGALANEQAALAWHRGQAEQAAALWQEQPATAPVLFNRGMAALFLGRPDEARASLTGAVGQIPDTSGWHHLGRLYLALAEMGAGS